MRTVFVTATILLASLAHAAADNVEFKCMTGYPTTSFLAETHGDEVVVRVIHHHGTQFAPIHEGIVVPNDIELIKSRAELLAKMGTDFTFKFPLEKCTVHSPGQMTCLSGDTQVLGGQEFTASMLSLYTSTSYVSEIEIPVQWVTLYLDVKGYDMPSPYITMRYSQHECTIQGPR